MLEELAQYVQIGEQLLKELNESEVIPRVARSYRKFYDELRIQQFSHDDAIRILSSMRIGK